MAQGFVAQPVVRTATPDWFDSWSRRFDSVLGYMGKTKKTSIPTPRGSDELRAIPGYWETINRKIEEMGEPTDEQAAHAAALIRRYQAVESRSDQD